MKATWRPRVTDTGNGQVSYVITEWVEGTRPRVERMMIARSSESASQRCMCSTRT